MLVKRSKWEANFWRDIQKVEDSIYDICESDENENKFYLDGVDIEELYAYLDSFTENDFANDNNISSNVFDDIKRRLEAVEDENKRLKNDNRQILKKIENVIYCCWKAAEEGNCVIVGRASGYILRKHENSLQVFIYADHEKRLQRAIEREGIQKADAESALKKNDKRRRNFYNSITGQDWDDPKHYEMYLNAGRLGIDLSVRLMMEAAKG